MNFKPAFAALGAAVALGLSAGTSEKPLKVLMIGNSFSVQMVRSLPPVAKDLGRKLDIVSLYIGGCSLERHWQNACKPETSNDYGLSWDYAGSRGGGDAPAPDACAIAKVAVKTTHKDKKGVEHTATKANIRRALKADAWDIVTIQQCSHLSWKAESYHPFGDDLAKLVRELAPTAKIVVQETWSYTPWDKRLKGWKITPEEMYAKLHAAYADFARAHGFDVIPTGTAVQAYRRELPVVYRPDSFGGDVCGSATFEKDAKTGAFVPHGDVFHMNAKGNHLQALVWAAKLFGADVTKCAYVPKCGITDAEAKLMRKVAMETVGK